MTTKFRAPTADGRFLYPIDGDRMSDGWDSRAEWVDGTETLRVRRGHTWHTMIAVSGGVETAQYRVRDGIPAIVGYTRVKDIGALPGTLTVEDWESFKAELGFDDDGDPIAAQVYRAERSEQQYRVESVDLSGYKDLPVDIMDQDAFVDPDPTFSWEVAAPYLVFGEAYAPVMPGALTDIRERLVKTVEAALPQAKVWTHKARDGVLSGTVTLNYEDKRTYPMKSGRRTEQRVSTKTFPFEIPIPKNITAVTKATAIRKFEDLVQSLTEQVDTRKATVCSHCSGEGVLVIS